MIYDMNIPIKPNNGTLSGKILEEVGVTMKRSLFGQDVAIDQISDFVTVHESGLAPSGRPAGIFLLLGPTGTGKTRTVEALATALHADATKFIKVDCGEFQLEHDVAKLIGSPPGYTGHRETDPLITNAKLTKATSTHSDIAIVLFDEIEKADRSFTQLLLGVLDKGTLNTGNNTSVNFEKTLIFMTSNLGAKAMGHVGDKAYGLFQPSGVNTVFERVEEIGLAAVRKKFSPEFVNRIDVVSVYHPLTRAAMALIVERELSVLQDHVDSRLGERSFTITIEDDARAWLLENGMSAQHGARNLKRLIFKMITVPMARYVRNRIIPAAGTLKVILAGDRLLVTPVETTRDIAEQLRDLLAS